MIRIALCDDNKEFLEQEYRKSEEYLTSLAIPHEICKFVSGIELINEDRINTYDLVLLDYEMEGMTGFEVAKLIREHSENTCIAFVTSFYEFSREGYRFDAIRYLVKQEVDFEIELHDCIDKAIRIKEKNSNNKVLFEFVDRSMSVNPEKIVFIVANKHYLDFAIWEDSKIHEYKLRDKMSNVMKILEDTKMFSLVRTGQLVNLKYIKTIDRKGIVWVSCFDKLSKMFQTSETRKKEFVSDYMRYMSGEG